MNSIKNLNDAKEKLSASMVELENLMTSLSPEKEFSTEEILAEKNILKNVLKELLLVEDNLKLAIEFTYFGQRCGGKAKSAEKTKAVRENGKKGGRPSKKILLQFQELDDKSGYKVIFDDNSKAVVKGTMDDVQQKFPHSRYKWSDEAYQYFAVHSTSTDHNYSI